AITATDDELRSHLADAELPPLLPALAYATGDLSLLRDDLRPDPHLLALPQGGMSSEQQEAARALAFDALVKLRDEGRGVAAPPSRDDLVRIMEHVVGGAEMGDYVPLLEEELALRGDDRRGPHWRKADVDPDRDFHVVVIGAGMSGILTAHRLAQAGIDHTVVEKNDDVGGTWFENTYPGCRVDNPNHNYSYSFAQRHDWPLHYSDREVLHGYFRDCAREFGVLDHIRLRTEVRSLTWDDATATWSVVVRDAEGNDETLVANAVVSAVGQLNRPHFPEIPGIDTFAGVSFHSAQWDHDAPIDSARVAVIGTGASSVQFTPEIAPRACELFLFQRTPPWLGPSPDYHEAVPGGQRWLYAHVPTYSEWNRFWMFWRMGDGSLPGVRVDPDWDSANGTVSAVNDFMRTMLASYLEREFAGRPDLLPHVVPTYPPGAKRLLRDNGVWAGALTRDNVTLVSDEIREITPTGIVTVDGAAYDVDVIVYGTGFQASNFLTPMCVTGSAGVDLHEQWDGDARAYLGITIPGFPNLFCLYGPNTNIVINGSIIYFSECGVRYLLGCLELLLRGHDASLDVRKDVHDEFNQQVDAENRMMAWGWSDVNSWYKNDHGRVAQNWPFTLLEYWQRTLAPDPDDYVVA
ncbi:MAG TPA: NAD(P)/FAD-dependent oxidoreductase, partial [Acidimicrobiia bacterium]